MFKSPRPPDPPPSREAAAAEAHKSRNAAACRRLYQVAGLVSILRTEKAVGALVKGLAPDAAAMRALVEEVTAEGSGGELRKAFVDSLLALCAKCAAAAAAAPAVAAARRPRSQNADLARHAKAIADFGKDGDLRSATALFEQLRRAGDPLSPLVCNCLLEACVQCGDLPAARRRLATMKAESLADVVSYNTVMKGCLSAGDLEGAHGLLHEMDAAGVAANRVTYHSLMHAMVLRGDTPGLWRAAGRMKEAGLSANAVTCSILLKAAHQQKHEAKQENLQ